MKIALLNFGNPWHVLASTSLIRGLRRKYPESEITFFVTQEAFPVIQYNNKIEPISGYVQNSEHPFDLAVNMTPTIEACNFMSDLVASTKMGFTEKIGTVSSINEDSDEYFSVIHKGEKSERHLLQVLYRLCGLTWKGEGYDLAYFPKNKTNKNRTGIAISHDALRQFIKNNLRLQITEPWAVPMKQNIFRRMDEINRCMYIITDDLFTLHASIALRKNVEFLDTLGLTTRIEFFGRGNYYRIFDGEWRFQMQKDGTQEDTRQAQPSSIL
jgi:hypothetical protein